MVLLSVHTGVEVSGVRRDSANDSGRGVRLIDHSLMFLGPKGYRGLGDKIVSVSVKSLTQALTLKAYDRDGWITRRTLQCPEKFTVDAAPCRDSTESGLTTPAWSQRPWNPV